ncbi:MAG: roadblock/LC7 domain-containing protein [Candidatus Firestonebacteria bacterium]|nr:roadblock/LC7 domain-containing protein [Candidatus Firestonebacteria bacterium]
MPNDKDELEKVLKRLEANVPEIEAAAVVSLDGLILASALPNDIDEDRVAAMAAAMHSLGEKVSEELKRGMLEQLFIRGVEGFTFIVQAGAEGVLTVLARKEAKLGLIFLEIKRATVEIAKILSPH